VDALTPKNLQLQRLIFCYEFSMSGISKININDVVKRNILLTTVNKSTETKQVAVSERLRSLNRQAPEVTVI